MDLPRLEDVELDVLDVLGLDLLWSLCPGLLVFGRTDTKSYVGVIPAVYQ